MIDIAALVDPGAGRVSRQVFVDEEIYRLELDRIFAKSWLVVAHESQLRSPGDYVTTTMGEDPVLVVRRADGSLGAYLNSCRHRGMKVCRADSGNGSVFTCTYHGWAYGNDGKLKGVPMEQAAYNNELDRSQWGLVPVAHIDTYKGLVFATWDPDAVPLLDHLGGMTFYLDALLDRRPGGTELIGGVQKWRLEGNWKLAAEQFTSDNYHAPFSHASAITVLTADVARDRPRLGHTDGAQASFPQGHGTGFAIGETPDDKFPGRGFPPILCEYYEQHWEEMVERLGEARVQGPIVGHANLFPNFGYLPGIGTLRVWHPRGPNAIEVHSWTLVDSAAPPEVKEAQRRFTTLTFGPAGIFEQDDAENWAEIQQGMRGSIGSRVDFNYQMGMGHERFDDPRYPGRIGWYASEQAARGFYSRYLELMEG